MVLMVQRWHLPTPAGCRIDLLAGILLLATTIHASAAAHARSVTKATSSNTARGEALRAMPLARLNETDRKRVESVLQDTTLYRRLPTRVIDCDPQLFLFLVRHPEVLVNIWEVLGVSQVALERTGKNTFRASDGHGTLGHIEVLYDQYNKQLVYAKGIYEGPLLARSVEATCVLLLRMEYARDTAGRYYVTGFLDAFVHLDRASLEVLAKTFQPLVVRAADYNFTETMTFVSSLSRTAERNPRGFERICNRLTKVPTETRERLLQISYYVSARASVGATAVGATGYASAEQRLAAGAR